MFFPFSATTPAYICTLSLHDALPISMGSACPGWSPGSRASATRSGSAPGGCRSEEHTSELQSRGHLVCRLLLEKTKLKVEPQVSVPTSSRPALQRYACKTNLLTTVFW